MSTPLYMFTTWCDSPFDRSGHTSSLNSNGLPSHQISIQ